jgi:hypothetical protein
LFKFFGGLETPSFSFTSARDSEVAGDYTQWLSIKQTLGLFRVYCLLIIAKGWTDHDVFHNLRLPERER